MSLITITKPCIADGMLEKAGERLEMPMGTQVEYVSHFRGGNLKVLHENHTWVVPASATDHRDE